MRSIGSAVFAAVSVLAASCGLSTQLSEREVSLDMDHRCPGLVLQVDAGPGYWETNELAPVEWTGVVSGVFSWEGAEGTFTADGVRLSYQRVGGTTFYDFDCTIG